MAVSSPARFYPAIGVMAGARYRSHIRMASSSTIPLMRKSNDSRPKKESPKTNLRALENGGYLLSHKCSTIGDVELNDPVRNGKGWDLNAITTLIMF